MKCLGHLKEQGKKAHSMRKSSWLLCKQHPGAGKTCVSSRWFQAPGTHFWSLPRSSSVFSLLMTQRGVEGDVSAKTTMINPADAPFLERAAAVFCLICRAYLVTCVFPQSPVPRGEALAYAQFQNTLMRRMPLWGHHYCEHL